jgi:CubicO group peptidase (beta-lactamase class C family)
MQRLAILAIFTLGLAAPVLAQDATPPPPHSAPHLLDRSDIDTWLDGLVPYALQAGDMAGAVVTVVAHGEVLTLKGYGDADAATGKPVDPERTLFRPGSISKLVTWTAVMQLVEQGALDLDVDINTYLDFVIPPFEGQPITLRNILTHTSGFEEQLKHVLSYDRGDSVAFDDLVKNFVPARIFAPGTTPAYSNYATALAGYIVQRVSGQPFADRVAATIFAPLGMQNATFFQELSAEQRANLSKGYATASGAALPFEYVAASPAGALTATAPDMAKFMLAHLNDGRLGDARILQPATARLMHAQALATIPPLNGMALGFYESSINGHRVISHGGDTVAFHSDLHLFLDEDVGLFISINSTGENGAAHKLRALLFSEFADRYFPAPPGAALEDIGQGNAQLLAGQWASTRRSTAGFLSLGELLLPTVVTASEDGKLEATNLPILGAPVREWIEVAPLVWQASNSHERIAAVVDDDGAVRFSLDSVAPIMVFDAVPWQRSASWVLPALVLSLCLLALAAVQWPVAALVRRLYGVRLSLQGAAAVAYHGVRASAMVMVAAFIGWFALLIVVMSDLTLLSDGTDPVLLTLQAMTIAASLGLAASAAANAVLAVRERRGVWSIIGAGALALATIVVIWVAFVFKLLKIGVSY